MHLFMFTNSAQRELQVSKYVRRVYSTATNFSCYYLAIVILFALKTSNTLKYIYNIVFLFHGLKYRLPIPRFIISSSYSTVYNIVFLFHGLRHQWGCFLVRQFHTKNIRFSLNKIYNKKKKSFTFNKKSYNLILQSWKLKTGYCYESQFWNPGFVHGVRQFCGYQYFCYEILFNFSF